MPIAFIISVSGVSNLGDAAAIERRADMGDAHRAHPIGLRGYPLDRRRADQRLVLLERMQTEGRSLNGGAQHGHRRVTFMVIALRQCVPSLGKFATAHRGPLTPPPEAPSIFPSSISPSALGRLPGLAKDAAQMFDVNEHLFISADDLKVGLARLLGSSRPRRHRGRYCNAASACPTSASYPSRGTSSLPSPDVLLRLLARAGAPGDMAKTEVTMGDEGLHAKR